MPASPATPPVLQPPAPGPQERTLAAVAHLAIAFGLFGIGFLIGLALTFGIWLYGKRSRYVAVHAEQAGWYQLAVLVLNVLLGATWLVAFVLVLGNALGYAGLFGLPSWDLGLAGELTLGLLLATLLFVFVLWFVGTIALGVYAALLAMAGRPFWYPVVGPWVRRRMGEPR